MIPQFTGRQYPATPGLLEDALVLAISGYVQNMQLPSPKKDANGKHIPAPPVVWKSSIPGYLAGFDPGNPPANFPGIVVQRHLLKIGAKQATSTVKILVGVFHHDKDKQGFCDVWNVIDRIVNGFWYDSMIGGVFSIDFESETHAEIHQPENMDFHPFYFGYIEQTFLVLKPQAKDYDSIYTVDSAPGNTDWNQLPLPSDI